MVKHIILWKLKEDLNGKGKQEVLDGIKENLEGLNKKCDFSYHSAHVGIENIRHRLWLLYKEEGTVIFSNIEGSGACVQIFLPSPRLEEQAADLLF